MKPHTSVFLTSSPSHFRACLLPLCLLSPDTAFPLDNATWETLVNQSYITALTFSTDGGTVWVGTPDGLEQRTTQHGELQHKFTQEEGLPTNYVTVLDHDNQGGLWIGTGRGLAHYRPQQPWQVFTQDNSSLPVNGVTALYSDTQGGVWIGTNGGGLAHYNTQGQWQLFNTDNSVLPNNQVTALYKDGQGVLWVGTFKGLARYSPQGQWQVFTPSDADLLSYRVNAIDSDSQKQLWVGTGYSFFTFVGGGLTHYNTQGQWEIASSQDADWSSDWVTTLDSDNQGGIWVGTNGEGLAYYSSTGQWETFQTDNSGLPNDGVTAIDSDSQGRLWIGTKAGLARLTVTQSLAPPPSPSLGIPLQTVLATPCDLKPQSINQACNAHGQTVKNFTVQNGGYFSNAVVTGTLTNQGWVSNLTVMASGVVTGGVVTGYIQNDGLMTDFEFKGASLKGGQLGGIIHNTSQVGGTFQNVTLQANTQLIGGFLKGTIQGDKSAPALLEALTIKAGSVVSGVKLGSNVIIEKGAKVEEEGKTDPPALTLPTLGTTLATNAQGKAITVQTRIAGGAAVDGQHFSPTLTVQSMSDTLDLKGQFQVDPAHLNKPAKVFVTVTYQESATSLETFHFKLNTTGGLIPWDEQLSSLSQNPFQIDVTLPANYEFSLYHGVLLASGILKIQIGYILADGTTVQSGDEITLTVE